MLASYLEENRRIRRGLKVGRRVSQRRQAATNINKLQRRQLRVG